MDNEYQKLLCIKQMSDTYKQRFFNIVEEYAPKLNRTIVDERNIYTLHDFDHHCINLYKYVSKIILNPTNAYSGLDYAINHRELYILNIAILLHDIGMIKLLDLNRDTHSKDSADYILEEYDNPRSPLSESRSGLTQNEINALAAIVMAHSDVRNFQGEKVEFSGLDNQDLTNEVEGKVEVIRAKLLANILRMADELDVTSDRLGQLDTELMLREIYEQTKKWEKKKGECKSQEELKKYNEQIEKNKRTMESYEHWNRLHYIKCIKLEKDGCAKIFINDEYIEDIDDQGKSLDEVIINLRNIYSKIQKEFVRFQSDVKADLQWDALVSLKKIEFETKYQWIKERLLMMGHEAPLNEEVVRPQLIAEEVSKKISEFVMRKKLYLVGHFYVSDSVCARDWINVNEILETEEIVKKCIDQLVRHIRNKYDKKEFVLMGVDFGGIILCSRLAYILGKPFTYVISVNKKSQTSDKEIQTYIGEDMPIVLITDVIASYESLKKTITDYNIGNRICAIYALLYREPKGRTRTINKNKELIQKTCVLNDSFSIELVNSKDCLYRGTENCQSYYKECD